MRERAFIPERMPTCRKLEFAWHFSKDGKVLGTFAVYYREPRSASREDRLVIERATHLAAIAIERQRAEAEQQVMSEIIQGVNGSANLDELFRLVHQSLKKVLFAEIFFVALYGRRSELFTFPFFVDQFDIPPPPQRLAKSCTSYVFRAGHGSWPYCFTSCGSAEKSMNHCGTTESWWPQ